MRYDGAADVDDAPFGCQRVSSAMSPPVLPGPEEPIEHTSVLPGPCGHVGVVIIVTPCRCSRIVIDDAVDAVVEVASCRYTVRGR